MFVGSHEYYSNHRNPAHFWDQILSDELLYSKGDALLLLPVNLVSIEHYRQFI